MNAHSHLEYAVYAGFGDGRPFGDWLATHIGRKRRLDRKGCSRSPARRRRVPRRGDHHDGGLQLLGGRRGGGRELGLRAIVYLEVFGGAEDAQARFEGLRAAVEETGLVRIGDLAHAPYTCTLDTYRYCLSLGIPVGTHLAESDGENEWLERGTGVIARGADVLVEPTGKRAVATLAEVLGPGLLSAIAYGGRRRDRGARGGRRPRRTLPPLERPPRLRHRAARRNPRRRGPGRARHGLAGLDAVVRPVGRDARGRLRRPGPRAASGRARRRVALHLATPDAAAALGLDGELGGLAPGKRADLTVVSVAGSPYHPVEDPTVAAVFGGSPGRVVETLVGRDPLPPRRDRVARGTQHRKRRPPANARLAQPSHPPAPAKPKRVLRTKEDQLFFARLRNHAKWVFVFLAVVFSPASSSSGSAPARPGSARSSRPLQRLLRLGPSLSSLQKKKLEHPKDAAAWLALREQAPAEEPA